ncbi:hypothetical protein TAF16_0292 [Anoxybacillus flavithermus]|uniref:Uncharacterized protein n=1 Tax=Anoxybacillus flavithermus TaxID=33934 RepID=A0A178TKW8_9BACL|nr:hypothetical protein TAF16_0292 [Anoxybacillus flavithermus]
MHGHWMGVFMSLSDRWGRFLSSQPKLACTPPKEGGVPT